MKIKLLKLGYLVPIVVFSFGFSMITYQDPWSVPDKAAKTANPLKGDAASLATGKSLWAKHCQSCHGKTGKGDGNKAASLKTKPGDFTTADFQKQSDGAIFYKTSEGRKDMPSFKKKIPDDDDRWSLINYIRTLK
ncbi:MAG TPA: c-type cytochrome [Flavitalea sp.]|nr:c-type cytochrome [Flavitalea sp.]